MSTSESHAGRLGAASLPGTQSVKKIEGGVKGYASFGTSASLT